MRRLDTSLYCELLFNYLVRTELFGVKNIYLDDLGYSAHVIQPACFDAGCYIEMATSYHQPHEYELVGG